MRIEQAVKPLGRIRIGFRELEIVLVPSAALSAHPLDRRVEDLRALLAGRRVIVTDCNVDSLLTEKLHDRAAEVRQMIIAAFEESHRHSTDDHADQVAGPSNVPRAAGIRILLESIEDCVALYLAEGQTLGDLSLPEDVRLMLVGSDFYDLALEQGVLSPSSHVAIWRSRKWKSRLMTVDELPDRYRTENKQWPASDYSRHCECDRGREAVARLLGISATIEGICYQRTLGSAIGKAVGEEQVHGWLATDLKQEHFIYWSEGRVAHVDHADDVFLLRAPTIDEMAQCIGPLYQQFDFVQWQGFREGYFDALGMQAVDVLYLFDGDPIHFILFEYCNRASRKLRAAGDFDEALVRLSMADEIVELMVDLPAAEKERLACQIASIRGDVHLQREALGDAEAAYLHSIERLEKLEVGGLEVGFELCGAFVNLGIISFRREDKQQARRYFDRAEERASALKVAGDERADYLLDAIHQNLSLLE